MDRGVFRTRLKPLTILANSDGSYCKKIETTFTTTGKTINLFQAYIPLMEKPGGKHLWKSDI